MAQLSRRKYNTDENNINFSFAEYPSIKIYADSTGSVWKNHLLYGDYIKILDTEIKDGRVRAKSRNTTGWVNANELEKNRVLEVNFVDIGQGDGCHIVTPADEHIIIDAGKTDNMVRYLAWRFNLYDRKSPLRFPFKVIISHSDSDHYLGFGRIFDNDKVMVDDIYHNGLVERPGNNRLGKVENGYLTGLVQNTSDMLKIINKADNRKGDGSLYCKTLYKALQFNPSVNFSSLSTKDGYLAGYNDTNKINNKEYSMKILGPIVKKTNGKDSLKTINDLGKDKNGHSVILKLQYGNAKILLGGDVNTEFGKEIHKYYKGKNSLDELTVDVAKACHHGSNHFHYDFVKSLNASATVISSGDDESYSHPRPDTIGALGKCGYGDKPLIFSTELARSNKEFTYSKLKGISASLTMLDQLKKEIKEATDETIIKALKAKQKKINKELNSFLTRYGMINLRTDGVRMILAQKYETPASYGKWDIHKLKYSYSAKRFRPDGED